jgi:hypothetical protein
MLSRILRHSSISIYAAPPAVNRNRRFEAEAR